MPVICTTWRRYRSRSRQLPYTSCRDGGCYPPSFPTTGLSDLQTRQFFCLQRLAASFASPKKSTPLQSSKSSLFLQNTGVGVSPFQTQVSSLQLPAVVNFTCMHPAIPHLLELQTVDQHIVKLRAELDSFPKRIREANLKLTGARNALAIARETSTHSLTERKKFELDVQQWKERAKKYREQSGAVKTNEAYKALQHEIANAEAEVAK